MGAAVVRLACLGLSTAGMACGYEVSAHDGGSGGVDGPNTWSIDDDDYASARAFLDCRNAQAVDSERDSEVGLTFQSSFPVGEGGSRAVSASPRLANDEIAVDIGHDTLTFVAQSGMVAWAWTLEDGPWPLRVTFTDLPGLSSVGASARLSGSLVFDLSVCE